MNIQEWDILWKRIEECYVEDWKNEYLNKEILDGTQWELKIESIKKLISINGSNDYPPYWKRLISVFSSEVKERIA